MGLRIGIDARLVTYRRGIGNFVYHLLCGLAEQQNSHDYFLYVDDQKALTTIPNSRRFHTRVLRPRLEPIWEQVLLPRQVHSDRLDVLHSTANTAPVFLPRRTALVASIHDVMYLRPTSEVPRSPSRRQRLGRLYRRLIVPHVAKRARHIITLSEFSKRDILASLGTPENKVTVVPLAPASHFTDAAPNHGSADLTALGLSGPYVFALGAVDPRKNTERILGAFGLLKKSGVVSHTLVIAGLAPKDHGYFRAIARDAGIADETYFLHFVDEMTLAALYRGAELFLYPSLYEGFGLPVVEAMASGTPVITSNTTSIPEVASEAAIMVDPRDVAAISQAMIELIRDPILRGDLIARGLARAQMYSWSSVAQQISEIYERAASGSADLPLGSDPR